MSNKPNGGALWGVTNPYTPVDGRKTIRLLFTREQAKVFVRKVLNPTQYVPNMRTGQVVNTGRFNVSGIIRIPNECPVPERFLSPIPPC